MENRFLEMDEIFRNPEKRKGGVPCGKRARTVRSRAPLTASTQFSTFSQTLSAQDRVLVVLIENGGVDLGIPILVDKILQNTPAGSLIPGSYRQKLVDFLRDQIKSLTDKLLESAELSINRYTAAKPNYFGDVIVLRDSSATYQELKNQLLALSQKNRIIDLLILTHGSDDYISVADGINGQKIRDLKTANGKPLNLRSVYMMNCVGSSLNQAWIDAGAKTSAGALRNNYLPEPTTYFFWSAWKEGQSFESAVTSAYRKTVNLIKDALSAFLGQIPGGKLIAARLDVENMDFIKDSSPVIQGSQTVTINTDDLSFTQTFLSSMATAVLPVSFFRSSSLARAASDSGKPQRQLSAEGLEFIKQREEFHDKTYNDAAGHCAIGYGSLLHRGKCDDRASEEPYKTGISAEAALELLKQKAREFQQLINDMVSVPLNQNQNDALVSFVYNVGGVKFEKSKLLNKLNGGDYSAVQLEIKKWTKSKQNGSVVDLPELIKQRNAEAELFAKPVLTAGQSVTFSWAGFDRTASVLDYRVPGTLPVIAQPTSNTCWAAVFTMMYCWKNDRSTTIPVALSTIGQKYVDMFNRDVALDAQSAKVLYDDAGLIQIVSFSPTVDGWSSLLHKYGPLYVDVGYNQQNAGTHAIIIIGISGDGSADGTSVTYVDPIGGQTVTLKFGEFMGKYEAKSAVEWPYTIVHWPAGTQSSQQSFVITHSFKYVSSSPLATQEALYSISQNPAAAVIAGMEVADAAQIGLAGVAIVQAQVSASQGSFSLSYDKANRMLTNQARTQMPGAQSSKKSYSAHLLYLSIGAINSAEADIIIDWEGNAYGEIGTPVIRRNLATSTEWSKSSANITITKLDRIPLPKTDPRTWPIVYNYEGTYDPYGNGYFEFSGEFEINAFGGLKFNRHEVVSRSMADWAIGGTPQDKVQKGKDILVPVPAIPKEQLDYLRTQLP